MSKTDACGELARLIAVIDYRLDEDIAERLAVEGFPKEWLRVLVALTEDDGQPMGKLAEATLVNPTTLTKMIDRMSTRALVYRAQDVHDRRKVRIHISDEGRAQAARLSDIAALRAQRLRERLGPSAARELADALRALI